MTRYIRASVLIGILIGATVLALYHWGCLLPLDQPFQRVLGFPDAVAAWRWPYQYAVIPVLALFTAWMMVDIANPFLKLTVGVILLVQIVVMTYTLSLYGHFFAPAAPLLAVVGSVILGFVYALSRGGKRKRLLQTLFGSRIHPRTFRKLLRAKEPKSFEGQTLSVSAVHIEFMPLSKDLKEETVDAYRSNLNHALSQTADFFLEQGAYLEECNAEGLRVLFGTPLPVENHASLAVTSVLQLDTLLQNLNKEAEVLGRAALTWYIGVASGETIIGFYGPRQIGRFSALGEVSNLAYRLSRWNVRFGTHILIDPSTYELASDTIEVRPVEMVCLTERKECVEIYEPLGLTGELDSQIKTLQSLFWEGVIFYRERNWEAAKQRFREILETQKEDSVSRFYLQRIEQIQAGNTPGLEMESSLLYGVS